MRILFLTQWFQPENFFKGLPFAKALAVRGHDVEVLTGFPNYPGGKICSGYRIRFYQREVMDGITVHRVPLYPSHDKSALRRSLNYLSFSLSAFFIGLWRIRKPDVSDDWCDEASIGHKTIVRPLYSLFSLTNIV